MKKLLLHLVFVVIVIADLVGEYLHDPQIDHIAKPLILIWIAGYFLIHSKNIDKKVVKLALTGFLFSWIGDLLMMFAAEFTFFVLGIASFLIAQIVYIFLFLRTIDLSGKMPFLKKKPMWLIPYMAFGLIVYIILFPHLDNMLRIAIFVYMVAILSMSAMALNRFGNGHPISFSLVFAGSVLFVVSDSMIAVNRFLVEIPYEGLLIMTSYIAAQYLIMLGLLKQYE
ncbi:lysoplasmalogenase [Draconibacterium sp. IB214405]|uniref:lysoplasmalogenase n=1 Tax=Draconibacterium sp. IB214405 TaxID=3097352 RepID=UPI002A14DC4E|nr:lysoplasmalogenase [Draconibacterium sp. IB214405]MDX8341192.1 lysoplasmalogenase [Draconibacterium sp. IB214405]